MGQVTLAFELDGTHAERMADALLAAGALSVTAEDALAGTADEQPMFDEPGADPGAWPRMRLTALAQNEAAGRALLAAACAAAGVDPPGALEVQPVADEDWVRRTQAQFPPIRISDRLWIVPSWHPPPDPAAINLLLDPGRAFGTGSHATTRLCLRWLERRVRGGETVIDYGCGSGILAIAAKKLGAGRVIGTDIDAEALPTARANALANDVRCEFQPAETPLPAQADLLVANILANPLRLLAPALARAVRAGGAIALSGVLESHWDDVAEAYRPWFDMEAPECEDGWVCLSGTRTRAPC